MGELVSCFKFTYPEKHFKALGKHVFSRDIASQSAIKFTALSELIYLSKFSAGLHKFAEIIN